MCKSFMDYSISHLETSIDLELYLRSRLSRPSTSTPRRVGPNSPHIRLGILPACPTGLSNSLQEIALTRRGLPALGHFVTALANHFDITPEAYRLHGEIALQERSEMRCLNYNELKQADLVRNRTTAKEYTQRTAYDTYFKKLQQGPPNSDPAGYE
ncbi:AraC family transcriptional regulator [Striga asiatica]|uniref:AraC family transcriptional regulator n=1 Tax=Striga asiatica TaxID=4170 RepID=A0A5A7R162_STRAF|nr:AraC family transcriptional regulator [Striga asiatica]